MLAADEPRHCAGWELNLPGGPFGRYFMGCSSLVSGSGAEEPWWGQQTFVGVTGSQPRSNTSVWGRERVVREGSVGSGEGHGLKICLEKSEEVVGGRARALACVSLGGHGYCRLVTLQDSRERPKPVCFQKWRAKERQGGREKP